jgi:hypothetical protein
VLIAHGMAPDGVAERVAAFKKKALAYAKKYKC